MLPHCIYLWLIPEFAKTFLPSSTTTNYYLITTNNLLCNISMAYRKLKLLEHKNSLVYSVVVSELCVCEAEFELEPNNVNSTNSV